MKNDYVIRRPTRADEPKIEVLAQEIWPGASEGKLSRRWWWNAEVPHCWVAEHGPVLAILPRLGLAGGECRSNGAVEPHG